MDTGQAIPAGRRSLRRLSEEASTRTAETSAASSFGRAVLGLCLILLVLGILPAALVLWVCVALLVFTCLRIRLQAQQLHQLQQGDGQSTASAADLLRAGRTLGHGGPVIRFIPGGGILLLHSDPRAALEQLNARLRQLDEEMGLADYDAYMRLNQHLMHPAAPSGAGFGARTPAVSDTDIAALPCFPYKPPRSGTTQGRASQWRAAQPAACAGAPAASSAVLDSTASEPGADGPCPERSQLACTENAGATAAVAGSGAAKERPPVLAECASGTSAPLQLSSDDCHGDAGCSGGGGAGGLVCSVCLDAVAEGSLVMTLPCLHQFHQACVTPWLRQQGLNATCPLCKTPVFR